MKQQKISGIEKRSKNKKTRTGWDKQHSPCFFSEKRRRLGRRRFDKKTRLMPLWGLRLRVWG